MGRLSDDERRRLVEDNLRLAYALAGRFARLGVEYDDLVQVAALALCRSAQGFDPRRVPADKFAAYAARNVLTELRRAVARNARKLAFERSLDAAMEPVAPAPEPRDVEADDAVRFALRLLPGRQRGMVLDHFGLEGRERLSLSRLALKYATSKSGVRRSLAQARQAMAWAIRANGWERFFDDASPDGDGTTAPPPRASAG